MLRQRKPHPTHTNPHPAFKDTQHPENTLGLFLALLLFRLVNSQIICTWFYPDEYWQSVEVAHSSVFGYGHLTWEWRDAKLRGALHPMIFAFYFWILHSLGLSHWWYFAWGPRLIQGVFAATTDICLYIFTHRLFGLTAARWALFCHCTNWFTLYCIVRLYSNSLEATLVMASLAVWGWSSEEINVTCFKQFMGLGFASLAVIIRPTGIITWTCLGIHYLIYKTNKRMSILIKVVFVGCLALVLSCIVDRIYYGEWTFVPLNFLRFNFFQKLDALYGVSPQLWYFHAFPSMFGTIAPFVVHGIALSFGLMDVSLLDKSRKYKLVESRSLVFAAFCTLLMFSMSQHKEFRFVLAIQIILFPFAGLSLALINSKSFGNQSKYGHKWLIIVTLFVTNVVPALYLGLFHQAGTISAMNHLAQLLHENNSVQEIHFLTNCHSGPYYSHIHKNIPMWFPDCSPQNALLGQTQSEFVMNHPLSAVQILYGSQTPQEKIIPNLPQLPIPSHIVTYDKIAEKSWKFLEQLGFSICNKFHHSHFQGDKDQNDMFGQVYILCRGKG